MRNNHLTIILILLSLHIYSDANAQTLYTIDTLLYNDYFEQLKPHWKLETQNSAPAKLFVENNRMVMDVAKDATVWFNQPLSGNLLIDCYRKVVMQQGENDRLSDMNFFWMASDPENENLFTRKGIFKEYDSLLLYYAGIGGNYNSTSRFRKYTGDGNKPVLKEYTDSSHLLKANHDYHVRILVKDGWTQCWLDEELYFSYQDPQPLLKGYLGFRTTKSRQEISRFSLYRVK